MLETQQIVYSSLHEKDVLQTLSYDEFDYMVKGNGFIIGAYVEQTLIAFRGLLVPPINEDHLGLALGLDDRLDKIIYQEISVVHPDFQGNRLQQQLAMIVMEELAKEEHIFEYVCCTVAPYNIPSLKDKFYQGMQIGALIRIYDGKLRYVFVKELDAQCEKDCSDIRKIPMENIEMQQRLLQSGWVGLRLIADERKYYVEYGKK